MDYPVLLFRGENFDANFFHSSGVDIDHSFLIRRGGRKTLLVPKMNESLARASFDGPVGVYSDAMKELEELLGGQTVQVDASSLTLAMASRLKRFCRLKDCSQELLVSRMRKTDEEASFVVKAAKLTIGVLESLDFKSARTELDLKKQILVATSELGLEPAFEPIVAAGRNTSFPHYRGGGTKISGLVLIDYGIKYRHYCSDITRCFILDGDAKKREQYERLQDICHFLADSLPGLETGKDMAKLAEELMAKAGFPKLIHAIGHGVGLDIHEMPGLGRKSTDRLARTTLAIEPAFYLKEYGMRFEETVWFDGKKSRIY